MTRLLRWCVLVVVLAVAASGCKLDGAYDLPLPGSPVSDDTSFQVTAEIADILNVVPKSPVMVDDVTVGEVTDVERVGWHAKVTMRVKDNVELPDNVIADIRQVSLLGEKYIALESPTEDQPTGRLADGDKIDLAATGRNPEVEEVLGALSFLLSGGGVAQLGTITQELNEVMSGRTDRLRHLLGSLEDVVGTIDDQKEDILDAMESIAHLTETLNAEKKSITGALDVAGPAVDVLAQQHDELIAMLTSLDKLGKVGTRVIGKSKDDILASLDHLQPVLAKLHEAGDSLAPGINLLVSFPFPKEAGDIVRGDYANTSIRADISLENIIPGVEPGGGVPGLPNPGEVLSQVEKCLRSGDLTSAACTKVLDSLNLLKQLRADCKKPAYKNNPVCQLINVVPGGDDGTPTVPTIPTIPGLPDLPILGGLLGGLVGGAGPGAVEPSPNALYGGPA